MGSTSQPRDQRGRWTAGGSGSEVGDHQSESPSTATRNVPGHGNVPRSQVVAKHSGAVSLGTEPPTVRLDNATAPKDKGSRVSARRERTEMNIAVDQRSKPWRSNATATAMTDFGKPSKPAKGWPYNN